LLLLFASFGTYFYALADVPRRDHTTYMLERAFFESDWAWLWHSLSWPRSGIMQPGDYYLFRPLQMAVVSVKDILFRDNLFASGTVNICMMALAGFSLYFFSRRMVGTVLALPIALLFMVQHAGLEIVAWGHISPYLLSLTFLGFALTEVLKTGPQKQSSLTWAGVLMLLGALFHEILIVALVFTAVVVLYALWRGGHNATAGEVPLRSYVIRVMALPVIVYLGLDLLNYYYQDVPTIISPEERGFYGFSKLFSSLLTPPGAASVAFFAPFKVGLVEGETGILRWDFGKILPFVQGIGLALCLVLMSGVFLCIRALRKGIGSALTMVTLVVVLLLCGFILGIGYGRIYVRDISYLYDATYYYSVTGYSFCLLIALGLHRLPRGRGFTILKSGALVFIFALIAINVFKTHATLKDYWPRRSEHARMPLSIERILSDKYCLAGFSPGSDKGLPSLLFRDHSCTPGIPRAPLYVVPGADDSLWLAELRKRPLNSERAAGTADLEPKVFKSEILQSSVRFKNLSDSKVLLLSRENYDKPDLAMTLRHGLNAAVIMGYKDPGNYIVFRIEGPLVYGRFVRDGRLSPMMHQDTIASIKSNYRIEVRHAGRFIYLFVNDNLTTFMPAVLELQGKVGIAYQKSRINETTFSNFVAAPSKELSPPVFQPLVRIED
jgi:hypothetical protein